MTPCVHIALVPMPHIAAPPRMVPRRLQSTETTQKATPSQTLLNSIHFMLYHRPQLPHAPCFLSDPDTHITSTQHTYGGSVNPANMVQSPDDVIDYWFDRLGLSLDTPLGALSDVPNLSPSVSVLDDISLSVSSIFVILRHIHWYSQLAHTVRWGS